MSADFLPPPLAAGFGNARDLAAEIEANEKAKIWINSITVFFQCDKDFTAKDFYKCLSTLANKLHYTPEKVIETPVGDEDDNVLEESIVKFDFTTTNIDFDKVMISPGVRLSFNVWFEGFEGIEGICGDAVLFSPSHELADYYRVDVDASRQCDPKAVLQAFNAVQEAFAELKFDDVVRVLLRRRDTKEGRWYRLPSTEIPQL